MTITLYNDIHGHLWSLDKAMRNGLLIYRVGVFLSKLQLHPCTCVLPLFGLCQSQTRFSIFTSRATRLDSIDSRQG